MWKKIVGGIVAVIVILVIVVAVQPSDFKITRSIVIESGAAPIFGYINDLHRWEAWSPYEKADPEMKKTFEGPPAGEGAKYTWESAKMGHGRMTIVKVQDPTYISIDLEFMKPMAARNVAEFVIQPEGSGSKVTWSMTGKNGFLGKAFCLFMNMDKMVGGDFDKGLAELKRIVEKK